MTNIALGMPQTERTELRLRISNLEAVALTYAADFVIRRDSSYAGAPELEARPAHGIVASGLGLPNRLGMPQFAADPWRLTGELWIMTVRFTVAFGATESIAVYPWSRGMNEYMVPRTHQGYVILRLPSRRDPRRPLRRLPQLERPARVLLAAEAVLTQEEWPPRDQRFLG